MRARDNHDKNILSSEMLSFNNFVSTDVGQSADITPYTVDIDGTDNVQCLEKENSCKTISYIIDNKCVPDVHLVIHINYHEGETYTEPCNDKLSQSSYECFVTVSGKNIRAKPLIEFAPNNKSNGLSKECIIFQKFLSDNAKNITKKNCLECSIDKKTQDHKNKLKLKNLVVFGLVLSFVGKPDFSADNVDFIDFHFSSNSSSKRPCFFQCDSCSFTASSGELSSNVLDVGQIELSFCSCLLLTLRHSSFSQTEGSSSVKILNPGQDGNNYLSVVNIQNCSVTNITSMAFLQVESMCGHNIGNFMQIFLEHTVFARNRVSSSPIVILGCADKSQLQIEILLLSNCSFSHNFGAKSGAIDLYSVHASVFVRESQFNENIGGSVGLVNIEGSDSSLNVSITSSEFLKNTGELAGSFWVAGESNSSVFMSVISSEFCDNTADGMSSAGSIYIKGSESSFTVSVSNSEFVGNSGAETGFMYIEASDSTFDMSVTGSKFWKNTGTIWWAAGAIFAQCSGSCLSLTLISTNFLGNTGSSTGLTKIRALFASSVKINMTNSTFCENKGRNSGSFEIEGRTGSLIFLTVMSCKICDNVGSSSISAGFLYVAMSVTSFGMHVISSECWTNRGGRSGCVSMYGSDCTIHMSVSASEFWNNTGSSIAGSGGSIYISPWDSSLDFIATNSKFCENNGGSSGSVEFVADGDSPVNISVIETSFINNSGIIGGAIQVKGRCLQEELTTILLQISSSVFTSNVAAKGGSAIHILNDCTLNQTSMMVVLDKTDFSSNVVPEGGFSQSGGALCLSSGKSPSMSFISITQCKFENNTSSTHGGALALFLYESSTIYITQCQFLSNKASGVTSDGGACYFSIEKVADNNNEHNNNNNNNNNRRKGCIQIYKCIFEHNTAADGGSIFQTSHQFLETEMELQDTSFLCCTDTASDFISVVTSSRFKSTEFHYKFHQNHMTLPGVFLKAEGPYVLDKVLLTCQKTDIILSVQSMNAAGNHALGNISNTTLSSLSARCARCTVKPFPAGDGSLHITKGDDVSTANANKLYQHTFLLQSPCQPCPFGADCSKDNIKALPNYWGYREGQLMFFLSCPPEYCCNGIDVPCDAHNSCASLRTAQLCGKCEEGFTESLLSKTCIADELCDDWWVWPIAFLLALTYLLWYMYRGDIGKIFLFVFKRMKGCGAEHSGDIADSSSEDACDNADNAFFDILVYFSNIMSLLKVQVQFQNSDKQGGLLEDIEIYFMKYLDIDVQHVVQLDLCPFSGINSTMKSLSRPAFTLVVFVVWGFLFSTTTLLMRVLKCATNVKQLKYKLLEGFVETSKYSYSGFAGATFLLLTCVDIRDKSFWKYDAEIECYSTLQKCVILFATCMLFHLFSFLPLQVSY